MLKSKKTIAKDLSSIVSDGNVITDESTIKVYAKNASHMEGNAIAVVFPNNTEEVSEIVKYCYKNNIKIYPQASASELTGSSLPREDGVIVSFERMNKIKNINILDSYVVVEPGVRLYDLNLELSIYGFMFPIDPASIKIATVGGAINTGAGGMRGVKYGTMKDWVNELEIVIPNEYGTILKIGCKTSKCRQGYDLVRLIVGSEGTLALVTEATLKITPLPENVITLAAFFDDIEGLVNALLEIKKNKLDILIMEFVDDKSVELTLKVLKINIAGNGHYFVTSIITSPESSERVLSLVENILKRNGAKNVYKAKTLDEAESEGIFDIRRNYDIGLRDLVVKMRKNPASKIIDYNEDISVPPSKLPEAVRRIREIEKRYGLPLTLAGHVGDGNLHPVIKIEEKNIEQIETYEKMKSEILKAVIELGGTVSSEHGIGLDKKKDLIMELKSKNSVKAIDIMKSIKQTFDPKNILNPGKIFEV